MFKGKGINDTCRNMLLERSCFPHLSERLESTVYLTKGILLVREEILWILCRYTEYLSVCTVSELLVACSAVFAACL